MYSVDDDSAHNQPALFTVSLWNSLSVVWKYRKYLKYWIYHNTRHDTEACNKSHEKIRNKQERDGADKCIVCFERKENKELLHILHHHPVEMDLG